MAKLRPFRISHRRCSVRKGVLRHFAKFTGQQLCQRLFWPEACNFIKKEIWHRCFSVNFCEISKNTFFTEHLCATASILCDRSILYFLLFVLLIISHICLNIGSWKGSFVWKYCAFNLSTLN